MKKLMIAAFAAAFGLAAHAAAYTWEYSSQIYDWNNDIAGVGTVSVYNNDVLISAMTLDGDGYAVDTLGVDLGTLKVVAELTNFSDGAGTTEWTYNLTKIPIDGCADPEGSFIELQGSVDAKLTFDGGLDFSLKAADNGYTAVPEPTSGLLLLLGVAGLALRRRRA